MCLVPTSQRVRTRAPVSSQTQSWLYYFSPSPARVVVMATVKLTFLSYLLTDKDVSSASYNLSSATTGSYYSCVSQITIGEQLPRGLYNTGNLGGLGRKCSCERLLAGSLPGAPSCGCLLPLKGVGKTSLRSCPALISFEHLFDLPRW